MVKRYKKHIDDIIECDDGDFVKYEDYVELDYIKSGNIIKCLEEENKKLEIVIENCKRIIKNLTPPPVKITLTKNKANKE